MKSGTTLARGRMTDIMQRLEKADNVVTGGGVAVEVLFVEVVNPWVGHGTDDKGLDLKGEGWGGGVREMFGVVANGGKAFVETHRVEMKWFAVVDLKVLFFG